MALREDPSLMILPVDFWGDAYLSEGCIAGGINYLHISGTGWIEPCVFVHFAVHNIKDTTIKEALKSKFMTAYREKQKKNKNRFLPCGIIDHPENLREAIAEARAAGENVRETHPGAGQVVNELAPELDRLAEEKKKIIGQAWDNGEV
jgi:MoaA/NifB/PqqE/SkfB family radical SAM enzyme